MSEVLRDMSIDSGVYEGDPAGTDLLLTSPQDRWVGQEAPSPSFGAEQEPSSYTRGHASQRDRLVRCNFCTWPGGDTAPSKFI